MTNEDGGYAEVEENCEVDGKAVCGVLLRDGKLREALLDRLSIEGVALCRDRC